MALIQLYNVYSRLCAFDILRCYSSLGIFIFVFPYVCGLALFTQINIENIEVHICHTKVILGIYYDYLTFHLTTITIYKNFLFII